MSSSELELQKMIRGFRVSDLHSLLTYAGRNKMGKKSELQSRALDLIKLHSDSINMKIKEIHNNRYMQSRVHTEPNELFPLGHQNDLLADNYANAPTQKNNLAPGMRIPGYVQSINHQMMRNIPNLNVIPPFALNPNVTFKNLPFFDVLFELLQPTSLVPQRGDGIIQEKEMHFYLSIQHLRELDSGLDVQVQLRIGGLENNLEIEDEFPTSVCIKVNNQVTPLPNPIPTNKPGVDPKRPKRPLDITSLIKRSTSEQLVHVSWALGNAKPYCMGVFLVRKQTSNVLIDRLINNGMRNPDFTTAMIKEKLCQDRDSEIATMSLRGSLMCPLGKIKMSLPCRALSCTHLQCFDAAFYIQMNEKKPKWICPVCDKPAVYKSLAIDGLFLEITRTVPIECTEVQFNDNGSWMPIMPTKKVQEVTAAPVKVSPKKDKPKRPVEVISLDSDSDTEDSWPVQPPKKKPYNKPVQLIPPVVDTPSSSVSPDSVLSHDPLNPSSSKSIPSSSKTNSLPNEKTVTSPYDLFSPYTPSGGPVILSSDFTPPPQLSPSPSNTTFQQETSNTVSNQPSTTGQSYDFDLYSLIQQNQEFQYPDISPEDNLLLDKQPDIISID